MPDRKVVIVTGSSRGIGKATALAFAKEGARVVVTSTDSKGCKTTLQEIHDLGGECLAVTCDVSKAKDVKKLVKQTLTWFGRIDVLVNNAGIYLGKELVSLSEEEWDHVIDVDLKGVFLMCREVIPHLPNGGTIINVASILGLVGSAGATAYSAAKGGVVNLTRSLALELAPRNIRVNAVAPGPVDTAMLKAAMSPRELKDYLKTIPLGRAARPDEIASAILFLSTAGYMTGHTLTIDGGSIAQ